MDDEPLPISLVAHHVFCPRRAWLEVHGERTDTAQMAEGVADHAAVDDPASSRGARIRSVDVRSESLRLLGRCDSIEVDPGGVMTVVEHKASPVRRVAEATDPQKVQLAPQALCLREQGHEVSSTAAIWFSTVRRRVEVPLDDDLLARAREAVAATRAVVTAPRPPDPLEDDSRCGRCSHVGVCLPDEHRRRSPARRIGVADPTARCLHLATPGSRASLRRGRITVNASGMEPVTVPLEQVAGLVVQGNADVSSALIREMLERGYPIVWCAWSGRVVGWASPAGGPNSEVHRLQHRLSDPVRHRIACAIVAAKIRNQALLLRRHDRPERTPLRELARRAVCATAPATLLGLEGRAAALYFPALGTSIKPAWATLTERIARPAADPMNAALNVAYSLLLADMLRAVIACGLDPAGGVLHSAGRNKPALALDLMEEFRAPVADSAVMWAVNNGELTGADFRRDLDCVRMTPRGRRALIGAYERRATSEFRHPIFGYAVSWRRAMEVQARLFLAAVQDPTAA